MYADIVLTAIFHRHEEDPVISLLDGHRPLVKRTAPGNQEKQHALDVSDVPADGVGNNPEIRSRGRFIIAAIWTKWSRSSLTTFR